MNNFNLDKNTTDKLTSMLNNGNLDDLLSQIPPDAIKQFSSLMNQQSTSSTSGKNLHNSSESPNNFSNTDETNATKFSENSKSSEKTANAQTFNNFDFSNIDINTMMKLKSIMEKMQNTSSPRNNLLQSLKPYLREEKKGKLDQYSNLLNMANMMEIFNQKNDNKENDSGAN